MLKRKIPGGFPVINTSFSHAMQRYSAASEQPKGEQPAPQEPQDRFDLSGVPTAVKLYDMSPIWGPNPGPIEMPRGVRGLC